MESSSRDIGARLKSFVALVNTTLTAGGAGDNANADGVIIDRLTSSRSLSKSAKVVIGFKTTLAAAATLTVTITVRHGNASNLSDASNFRVGTATVVKTGLVTAGNGTAELDVDLSGAKQYIQVRVLPDLSAGGTDTAEIFGILVAGGFDGDTPFEP